MIKCQIFLFLLVSAAYGQNIKSNPVLVVDYDLVLNDTTDVESDNYALKYRLISNGSKSYQNLMSYIDTTLYDKDGYAHVFTDDSINKPNFFKIYKKNKIIYGAAFSFKQSGRITDFPEFNFIEGKNVKNILGYECKQLYVSFRGRDYEVYYTPDLDSYRDGPWKFMGAPGLILEVKSFTGAVTMIAKCIDFSNKLYVVEEPLDWRKRDQLIYSQFVDRRSTWREKVKAKFEAEDPMSSINIPYRNFEIYLPYYVDNHR